METNSIILVLVAFIAAIILLKFLGFQKKDGDGSLSSDLSILTQNYKSALDSKIKELQGTFSHDIGLIKGLQENVSSDVQKLTSSFSGSKNFGTRGELKLENALKNYGFVENREYIKNQNYKLEGTVLNCEFGLLHPSKLVLPIDVHWPMTKYYNLIELRDHSGQKNTWHIEQELKSFKEIVKDYLDKAKEVRKKYLDHPASMNFSIIYCPSESLHHELATYVDENKDMFIDKMQRDHKATLLGPSTLHAFLSSILLGFNTFAADKKAKKFSLHWDALVNLVRKHLEQIESINNKIQSLVKASNEFDRAGQKLNAEIEHIKDSIQELDEEKK